jgi:hypothetical protein
LAKNANHECAEDEWQACSENCNGTCNWATLLDLTKVEVHTALKDHERHSDVTDKGEDVGRQNAFVRHVKIAHLLQAFFVGVVGGLALTTRFQTPGSDT